MQFRNVFLGLVGVSSIFGAVACGDDSGGSESAPQNTTPAIKSRRGESCASRNDCDKDLSCINNRCIDTEYPVDPTAKECFVVECTESAQCCADFFEDPSCPEYRQECNDFGDQFYCDLVQDLCVCNETCVEEQCVTQGGGCTSDLDCPYYCDIPSSQCVQCRNDGECGGGGLTCQQGFCTAGCVKNEECPLFNSCQSGKCVETGCTSDRECILFTTRPDAVCKDGECTVDCESNAECGELQACIEGKCTFIGCETNDECRTALRLENTELSAVCRAPTE